MDRITVYRMLRDGRIKGVKIGQQWRFTRKEVERLVAGPLLAAAEDAPTAESGFPIHCLQTIQNLFSNVSQMSALMLDTAGQLITVLSNPCALYSLLEESPEGRQAGEQTWRRFVEQGAAGEALLTCHAGLHYICAPVMDQGYLVALFLAGQFVWESEKAGLQEESVRRMAADYHLPVDRLKQAARQTLVVPDERRAQVISWPGAAAQAVESILIERTGFVQRLQQIADLTQIP